MLEKLGIRYAHDLNHLHLEKLPFLDSLGLLFTGITELKLSELPRIKSLELDQLIGFLNSLEIESLDSLGYLQIWNHTRLNRLKLENLENLRVIEISNLKELLDIPLNPNNSQENLREVYINHCDLLDKIDLSGAINLDSLSIINNSQLNEIFIKNKKVQSLVLDQIPNVKYICADPEEILTIQNLLHNPINVSINSFCPHTIEGNLNILQGIGRFRNIDDNCTSNDSKFSFLPLKLSDDDGGIYYFYSNNVGEYQINLPTKNYTLTPEIENSDLFYVSPESVNFSFTDTVKTINQDFCITPKVYKCLFDIAIVPLDSARPGFDVDYELIVKNIGTIANKGLITLNYPDEVTDFISSVIPIDSSSTNRIFWKTDLINPFEERRYKFTLNLNSPMENPPLNGGDIFTLFASIKIESEIDPVKVFDIRYIEEVVNAYDPNDKRCLEGNVLITDMIGEYIHYMIRFENTGSAEAVNVVVRDEIDTTMFDINSIQITDASHEMETRISEGKILEFIYKDIYLPFDDATNDGHVVFKIKTLPHLTVGDTIANTAEIYFDYNFPIITNTESTTFQELDIDYDNDGFLSDQDCNDANPNINPNAIETCDGLDNNCDGQIDEGFGAISYYVDADNDGYGDDDSARISCIVLDGLVTQGGDCNDNEPNINPDATDISNNEVDENCDGISLEIDADNDGYNSDEDCDDTDASINPDAAEVANNDIDENCDGQLLVIDNDIDGYNSDEDCDDDNPAINPNATEIANNDIDEDCDGISLVIDADNDGYNSDQDCNDADASTYPGAEEICDGLDNNCDGTADEGLVYTTYYADNDGDGYGDANSLLSSCKAINGMVTTAGDCNDNNPAMNPDATEIPNNDIDEDCDGEALIIDNDNDGYNSNEDCDDSDATVNPDAAEICDDIDNNCDGQVDEDLIFTTYYIDQDGDGYGDEATATDYCSEQNNLVTQAGDCDDTDATINPDAEEIIDNMIDEDCNGIAEMTSSVEDLLELGINVYPNPVRDILIIENANKQLESLKIYNLLGEQITKMDSREPIIKLDVSEMLPATYIIKFNTKDREYFNRFVKM